MKELEVINFVLGKCKNFIFLVIYIVINLILIKKKFLLDSEDNILDIIYLMF